MAQDAPNWYIEQWKRGAHHKYQNNGFTLKNTVMPPVKMDGTKLYFLVAGTGEAEEDVQRGDQAVPMNQPRERIEVSTKKSRAFDEVYEDDLDQMSEPEMQITEQTSAKALGRVHDRTIINALDADATEEVGAYTTPIDLEILIKAKQKLMAADVDITQGDIFCPVDSVSWSVLTTYKQFVSSDYVGPDLPYTKAGTAKTWNGIHVFHASDSLFPLANTTELDTFMYHRHSTGFGTVRDMSGNVQWDNRKDCWTHNMRMRIGCKVILPEGIVRIKGDYDPAHISVTA